MRRPSLAEHAQNRLHEARRPRLKSTVLPVRKAKQSTPHDVTGWTKPSRWAHVTVIEDDSTRALRRTISGVKDASDQISVRLHRIDAKSCREAAKRTYSPGALNSKLGGRAAVAMKLLNAVQIDTSSLLVAGTSYGCNHWFIEKILDHGLSFALEIRPSTAVRVISSDSSDTPPRLPSELLESATWHHLRIRAPQAEETTTYSVAELARIKLSGTRSGRLLAAQVGGILGIHRGTIFFITSDDKATLGDLINSIGWVRWIRSVLRRDERSAETRATLTRSVAVSKDGDAHIAHLQARPNNKIAKRFDIEVSQASAVQLEVARRGALSASTLNVVELFAGAGGMGLGFLLAASQARRYRLVYSGEVHPIYVGTLNRNHRALAEHSKAAIGSITPACVEPVDLRSPETFEKIRHQTNLAGETHILVGGPPCQGFSNANRNSWHSKNPHNHLVDVFVQYVKMLRPKVFLMENVQGILWTQAKHKTSDKHKVMVVDQLSREFRDAGYTVFPKLLDAAWYGVPQFRSRFFLLGLREDLGYGLGDFGSWGPFPLPTHGPGTHQGYTTVRDAISDLPRIGNGHVRDEIAYDGKCHSSANEWFSSQMRLQAPPGTITDHVTSKHAEYVIERYKKIPAGGNWMDIADQLSNYANVSRTHSNIYRRLTWSDPSITIGHYRKSMLVHPSQARGLSLREACRLQSFPDWFRFMGNGQGGLAHKQQQLANAVCPLVTKAIAEYVLGL